MSSVPGSRRQLRALAVLQITLLVCSMFGPGFVAAAAASSDPSPAPSANPSPTPEPTPTPAPTPEPTPVPDPSPSPTPSAEPSSRLVTFRSDASASDQLAALAAAGVTSLDSIPALRLHAVLASDAVAAALAADARVAAVDLDRTRAAEGIPDDTRYGDQWSLPKMAWEQAYGVVDPAGSAVVAILDTGVSTTHPDLDGVVVAGASFVDGSVWSTDANGHGTALAGIVAAETNNGVGIAGVGYDGVRVMPVTVLGVDGTGQDSDIIEGLVWAADHGADVALMAFSSYSYSAALQAAIDYAWSRDVVLVAAVGNDGSASVAFPAGDRGVIGVSNTDSADALATWSNHGEAVFLAAPGVDILTTSAAGGYSSITGTSASAASVAGAAALLRAADAAASNGVIVGRLARNADPAGTAAQTGNGRINIARSLADAGVDSVQPAGAEPGNGGPFVGPYIATAIGNFEQCRNGTFASPQPCTSVGSTNYQNGNLGGANSHYREGDSVPFRASVTGMLVNTAGRFIEIEYDNTASGEHAYDYLTTWNRTESTNNDPCVLFPCSGAPLLVNIPTDPSLALASPPVIPVPQAQRQMAMWGGTIQSITYVAGPAVAGPGSTPVVPEGTALQTRVRITYTATSPTVVFAWGGHVATEIDWGTGDSAGNISGSPYHMRIVAASEGNVGNQDRSASAFAPTPTPIVTTASASSINLGQSVTDTATVNEVDNSGVPNGTMTFFVCGPSPSAPDCTTGGTQVGGPVTITPVAGDDGTATSAAFTPVAGGSYCFRAEYVPAANAPYSPAHHTNLTTECFTVNASANLSIVKSDSADPVSPGQSFNYTLLVTNLGPTAANSLSISDTVPSQFTVSGTPTASAGSCSNVGNAVSCSLASLSAAAGSNTWTITIPVTVNANTPSGIYDNTASVTSTTSDPTPGNNSDTESTTVAATADLSITKSDGVTTVVAGDGITRTYTITVSNAGPSAATPVTVTDTWPAGFTRGTVTPSQGTCSGSPSFTCSLGTIASGGNATVTVSYTVPAATSAGTQTNTAVVSSPMPDGNSANNTASDTNTVQTQANLSITKTDGVSSVIAGDGVTYTYLITVANAGPSNAQAVSVTDTWPAGFTQGTVSPSQGTCSGSPSFTCSLGTLAASSSATITVTYTVPASTSAGTRTNSVTVTSTTTDPTPGNNTATDDTTVVTSADLSITKTDGVTSVTAGTSTTYTITVTNNGPSTVPAGVVISDPIPAGTTGSETEAACSIAAGTFSCTTGAALAPGASVSYQLTLAVSAAFVGSSLSNTVSITTSPVSDPNVTNDSATDTDTVNRSADLSIAKTDGVTTVTAGDGITRTYTITVTNVGPSDATGVSVADTWPAGFAQGTVSPSQGTCSAGPSFTCTLGTIAAGGNATISVTYTVPSSTSAGDRTNSVTVSATTADPAAANNTATDTTTVVRAADLADLKTVSPNPAIAGTQITYTIKVENFGPSDADGVVLTDTLPAGLNNPMFCVGAGCIPAAPWTGSTSLGTLTSGQIVFVTIVAQIDSSVPDGTTLSNTATVASNVTDPAPTNNSSTATVDVDAEANLSITKTDGVSSVIAGDGVTYTYLITVANAGPSNAQAVSVTDTWPAGFSQGTVSPSQGTCSGSPSFTCSLGTLAASSSATITVTYTVPASTSAGTRTNSVTVTSTTTDPTPANNTATDDTTVVTSADLSITKTDGVTSVTAGTSTTYTITVTNNGPSTVPAGVVISDPIPAGTTGSETEAACSIAAGTFSCTTGAALAPGASVSYQLTLAVSAAFVGSSLSNTVSITTSPVSDPNVTNDSATDTDTVNRAADLSIAKTDGLTTVTAGDGLTHTYTIAVTNGGPSDASGVSVSDTWPASGVVQGTVTPSQGTCSAGPNFTCSLGTIAAGGNATISVTYTVPSSATAGDRTNSVTVSATTADPVSGNNSASDTTTVVRSADLADLKTVNPDPVIAGNLITYTILVTNQGPSDADGVVLTDSLPAGLNSPLYCTGPGCTPTLPWTGSLALGTLTSGQTVYITIRAQVDSSVPDGTTLTNTATVTATTDDPAPGNNSSTATAAVDAEANLSITKSDGVSSVIAGDGVTYTYLITVANAGPSNAQAVSVTDTWPAGFSQGTVSPSQGTCSGSPSFTCSLGTLAASSSATITVTYTVPASTSAGTRTNSVTVTSTTTDPTPANNTATDDTTVVTSADLSIAKTDSPDPVIAGTNLTYTLTITNNGPSDALGVSAGDALPAGTSFVSASAGCTFAAGTVTCTIGTLAAGATAVRTITVLVASNVTGSLSNTASVTSSTTDPTPGNNSDTEPTTVNASADLRVIKTDSPDPVLAGNQLTYTISVDNLGPSDNTGFSLTDTIPAGTSFVSASPACGNVAGTVTCTSAGLVAGGSVTWQIVVTVASSVADGTTISNTAAIATSATADPNATNNSDTEPTLVNRAADVADLKTVTPDPVIAGNVVTYTILVTNSGPSDADNVTLSDTLPAALLNEQYCTGIACSPSIPWTGSVNLGTIASGGSVTVRISATVDPATPAGPLTNTATVSSAATDPNTANNSSTATTTVVTEANLSITKSDGVSSVIAGDGVTYTYLITVANAGPSNAQAVSVTDTWPAGFSQGTVSPSQGTCSGSPSFTCSLGTLAASSSATITVTYTVPASTSAGTRTNSVTVSSTTTDPTPGNNTATDDTTVVTSADLSIAKTDSPDPVIAGTSLTYTLTITNNGPSDALGVSAGDALPAGTSFVSASAGCTFAAGTVTCTIGTLAAGATAVRTITVLVASNVTGSLSNTASVTSSTTDPTPGNNSDTEPTTVNASADLRVIKTDSPDPVLAGNQLTYTISVDNLGPSDNTGFSLTDTIPAGTSFVSASPACGNVAGTVTCTSAGLVAGGSVTWQIVVTVASSVADGTTISNTAAIATSATADPNATNNSDTEPTLVNRAADVADLKTVTPDPVIAGNVVTYTILVTNSGPSDADNVTLSDTLPAALLNEQYCTGIACSPSIPWTGSVNLGTIASGGSVTVRISATVDPATPAGPLTNTATVSSAATDPNTANNSSTATTTVVTEANLSITKSDGVSSVIAGDGVTYTYLITVANAGPSNAQAVSVTDTWPAGFSQGTVSPSQGTCSGSPSFTCSLGTLAASSSATITVTYTVPASTSAGTRTNSVTVSSTTTDPTPGNNTATDDTTVVTSADLSIAKTDSPDPVIAGTSLTYTLTITNNGPSDALGVSAGDALPAGTSFVSASAGCTFAAGTVTCTIGTLAAGATAVRTITVLVASNVTGSLSNTASVTSSTTDPTPGNNSDTEPTTVNASADLRVIKTDSPDPVLAGNQLTYTISVDNLGPSDNTGFSLTDTIPAGTSFVSASPACGNVAGTVTCTSAGLVAGGSVTWQIVVTVASSVADGTTISNTAAIATSATADPNATNNSDTEPTLVNRAADVADLKTVTPDPVIAGNVVTYTILVTNSGPSDADNVTLSDTLPAALLNEQYCTGIACSPSIPWTGSVNLGTIASGGSVTVRISATVDPATPAGPLTNTATVSSAATDPNTANNSSTATTTVVTEANLSITKSDGVSSVIAGDGVTYTYLITVANAGPSNAQAVSVTDTWPAGFSQGTVSPSQGTCSGSPSFTCSLGTLAASSSATITVTYTVPASTSAGTRTNSVTVSSTTTDPTPGNNTATDDTTVVTSADLSIAKTDSPDPVIAGTSLTYTLTITNNGPSDALGVSAGDALPAGTSFVSASAGCTFAAGTVTCTIGTLAAGATAVRTITVLVASNVTGSLSNTASVTSSTTDPTPGNNSDTEPTTVNASADLRVIKTDSPDPVLAGNQLTYTISVDNLGPSDNTGFSLTDTIPAGTSFVSASPACGNVAGTVTCTSAGLVAGGSVTWQIVVTVASSVADGTTISNTAAIATSATADPNATNNSDTEPTLVNRAADVADLKTVTPDPVIAGNVVTYTILVTNSGPSDADNVTLSDTLPAALLNEQYCTGIACSPSIPWTGSVNLGTIASGGSVTVRISATVDPATPAGPLTNTATVSSAATDPNTANNSSTATTTVVTEANLSITKSDGVSSVIAGDGVTYTYLITVANAGPSNAQAVSVTDTWPAGFSQGTVSPSQGTCSGSPSFTCSLGTLAASSSATITVTYTVPASTSAGTRTNSVTVSSTTTDPTPGNNTATDDTTVVTSADLSIAKTDSPDPVIAGTSLTYTLTITNNGPSDALGVSAGDALPAGTSFVSASAGCTFAAGTVTCTIGTLAAGATAVRTITVLVASNVTGSLSNTASVTSSTTDPTPGNNSDTEPTTVNASADLRVIKTDSPDPVLAGNQLTYTISVDNLGPSDNTGFSLTDTIPAGTSFVSASPACGNVAGTVTCTSAGLVAGGSVTWQIVVTVASSVADGTTISNTAAIATSATADPNATNNSDTEPTLVNRAADVADLKTVTPDPVIAGNVVTYTILVTNSGPSDADNVTLSDTLPAALLNEQYCTGIACSPSIPWTGSVNLGTIASGGSVTVRISATVDPATPAGPLTNTATVSSAATDPNTANNSSTATTTVVTEANLSITKSDGVSSVIAGDGVTYTYLITVANAGPSNAQAVSVTDTWPAGFSQGTVSPSQGTCSGSPSFTCSLGTLAASSSATITVTYTVPASTSAGTRTNSVTVSSTTTDPTPGNNTATDDTTVVTSADLSIAKTDSPDPVIAGTSLTYTLTITNNGPSDALGVSAGDALPAGTSFVSASAGCTFAAGTVTCTIGTLAAGATAVRTITVLVASNVTGSLSNTASVTSSTTDPTPGNNSDTEPTTVNASADLRVIKTDSPDPVLAGNQLTYTISVDNLGPSDNTGFSLTDTIPAGTSFVSASPACGNVAGTVTCTSAGLVAGGSVTWQIVVTVASSVADGTTISNTAAIATSATADPNATNNSDTEPTLVNRAADVADLKTVTPDPVIAGNVVTYTILVTNSGPSDADNVTLSDTLPAALLNEQYCTGIACSPSIPWTGSVNLGTIASGGSVTVRISATVDPATPAGPLTNTATVSSAATDPNTANNSSTATTTVVTEANLSITKSDGVSSVIAGDGVTYTYLITVANAGPSNAQAVSVTDTWPAGFAQGTVSPSQGPACTGSPSFTCALGTIAAGGTATVTVSYTVPASTPAGSQTNTASVTTTTPDPVSGNDSASDTNTVVTSADLSITKTDGVTSVTAGAATIHTYTITVTNGGPSDALAVSLSDTWPAGFAQGTVTPSQGPACTGSPSFTCSLGTIAAGGNATVTVTYTVPSSTSAGDRTNSVTVSATTADPVSANSTATDTTTVVRAADLADLKTVSPNPAIAGTQITYTIKVENFGPSDADGVVLTDTLPAGLNNPMFCVGAGCIPAAPWTGSTSLGTLTSGQIVFVTIVAQIDPSVPDGTTLSNTATVASNVTDPAPTNNSSTATVDVDAEANLSITKTDSVSSVTAGDGVTYTYLITVANAGPSNAQAVSVTDTWPAGFAQGSITPSQGPACTGSPSFTCALGTIAASSSATITVTYTVPASTSAGTRTNSVTVTSTTTDPTPANNTATDDTTVVTSADLSIAKTDGVTTVTAGDGITRTYTITVTNGGPSDALAVSLSDTWPAGFTRGTVTPSQGSCSGSPSFTCTLNTIAAGGNATVTVSYTVPASTPAGSQTNTASVTTTTTDPNTTNNSASDTNTVATSADLSIAKTDGVTTVTAGDGITRTYTITVTNGGPSDATGVSVSDTWPAGFAQGTVSPSQGPACTGSPSFTCSLGTIAAGGNATVTVSYTVPASTPAGSQTNTASVTTTTTDPNTTNNSASDTNTVVTSADLRVTKTDSPDPVLAGTNLTYTISVDNLGPSDNTGFTLSDTIPAGTSFVSASPACGNVAGTVTCTSAGLVAGTSVSWQIIVAVASSVADGTTLSNTAAIATNNTADPVSANNSDTEPTLVNRAADVADLKTVTPDPVIAGNVVTYTILVTNQGPSDADNVTLSDTLPAALLNEQYCTGVGCMPAIPWTGSVNLGTIASGGNVTVRISATVDPATPAGPLTNTATVSSATNDPNTANNTSTATTTVQTQANLSITKTDGVASVTAGDGVTYTYTITVANAGPSNAQAVSVTDTWPAGFAQGTVSPSQGPACTGSPSFTCALGTIAASSSATITVTYTVPASTSAGTRTNSVTVTSTTTDPSSANNTATDDTTVVTSADLSITKSDSPDPVIAGQQLTYTLLVSNGGPSDALGVSVSDTLPAGTSFVSSSPSQGTCSGTSTVTCSLGTIAAGGSATITIVVTVASNVLGSISNTASVTSSTTDPTPGNNSDTETTTVQASADLSITKSDGVTTVTAGDGITRTYTITVTNGGPSDALAVSLSDTWPAGFAQGTVTPSQGSCSGSPSFTCTLNTIAAGGNATVTVSYTVPASTPAGSQTNTASVTTTTTDPNTTNNSASDTNTVVTSANMSITKSGPATVFSGDTITYNITVDNLGPSDAQSVVVTDVLPANTTFHSASGGGTYNSGTNTVTWNLGTVTPAQPAISLDLIVTTTFPLGAGTFISNTAAVSSTTTDPTPGNNQSTKTTEIVARPVGTTSTMTNSAFQLVDNLDPWTITDFEILMNNQNTIVATNPGQFYYHQRGVNTFATTTSWEFRLNWPDKFSPQVAGGMPIHAYVQLAGQTNVWTDWTPQSTNLCWNAAQNQCGAGTADGTITVNNVPAGATVWVNAHLDYNLKGTTQSSTFTKAPITYGPFQSDVIIKAQPSGAIVGTSTSNTSILGRGKKVTVVYGKAVDSTGAVIDDAWIQLKQGSNSATTMTDSNGDYLFYEGQACTTTDGIAGSCTGTWTSGLAISGGATVLTILGNGVAATPTATFPTGTTVMEVRQANVLLATVTAPTLPTHSISVSKGSAYNRNLKFRN